MKAGKCMLLYLSNIMIKKNMNNMEKEFDGYNYISSNEENIDGWRELWLEYLEQNNTTAEEYPLEEYARDNGYIPNEER